MAKNDKGGKSPSIWLWVGIAAVLVALTAGWFLLPVTEWLERFNKWIESLGAWGFIIFALVYVVAVIFLVPAGPLTIAAGVAFGFWALPLVVVSATVGAVLAFLVARYVVREKVEGFVKDRPKFKAVDKAVSEQGWKIVGLLRLSPVVPFNLQNYFFGVTKVGLLHYAAATFVGIIPGTILYVYLGTLGKQAGSSGGGGGTAQWIFFGIGLVATAAVAVLVTIKAKAALKEAGVGKDG